MRTTALVLGLIAGIFGLFIGLFGYALGGITGSAVLRLLSIAIPVASLAGGALARTNPVAAAILMLASAAGMTSLFGFNFFTAIPVGVGSAGSAAAFLGSGQTAASIANAVGRRIPRSRPATRTCRECGNEVSRREARFCGKCGTELPSVWYISRRFRVRLIVIPALALAGVFFVIRYRANYYSSRGKVVAFEFVRALQGGDLKTVIDLTAPYQSQLESIRAQNPDVLKTKVSADYYKDKVAELSIPVANPIADASFSGEKLAGAPSETAGDPGLDFRVARVLLPRTSRWQITEWRLAGDQENSRADARKTGHAYIAVTYPSIRESPQLQDKFLKSALLDVSVDVEPHLILDVGRLEAGDAFWPSTDVGRLYLDRAQETLAQKQPDAAIAGKFLDSAVQSDQSLGAAAGPAVVNTLAQHLSDLHYLGKDRFISLFELSEKFGLPEATKQSSQYRVENALYFYEKGNVREALALLDDIAKMNPSAPEGRLASQILTAPIPGRRYVHEDAVKLGYANDPELLIQLMYFDIEKDGITLTFSMRDLATKAERLIFATQAGQSWRPIYLLDNVGREFEDHDGFIGAAMLPFNGYNKELKAIPIDPGQELLISARFPMISPGANSFKFMSPVVDGWQQEWWVEEKIKPDPFD